MTPVQTGIYHLFMISEHRTVPSVVLALKALEAGEK